LGADPVDNPPLATVQGIAVEYAVYRTADAVTPTEVVLIERPNTGFARSSGSARLRRFPARGGVGAALRSVAAVADAEDGI
jgi:hypothetical protein